MTVMDSIPKDVIVLGTIKSGVKKFDKICKIAKIESEELEKILERLEERDLIKVVEKKGWLGKKIELYTTDKGNKELENRIHELEGNWQQLVTLYKKGDKEKLNEYLEDQRGFFPMMIFFGIIDMMMFSMMFSLIGASMTDYVPAEQIPSDVDGGDADGGAMDDGGFDIDIGF